MGGVGERDGFKVVNVVISHIRDWVHGNLNTRHARAPKDAGARTLLARILGLVPRGMGA